MDLLSLFVGFLIVSAIGALLVIISKKSLKKALQNRKQGKKAKNFLILGIVLIIVLVLLRFILFIGE